MGISNLLFDFLREILYSPRRAVLDVERLPQDFRDLGEGLNHLARWTAEAREFAQALARGELNVQPPPPGNELGAPLKSLHAALQHLTWQTQQIAKGDYQQRVEFMGDFDQAFNSMVCQLEKRRHLDADERFRLQQYLTLLLDNCQDIILLFDIDGRVVSTSKSYLSCCEIQDPITIKNKSYSELFSSVGSRDFLQLLDSCFHKSIHNKLSSHIQQEISFGNDENMHHYSIQISPMMDEKGVVSGTMLFFHDMTENIRAQRSAEYSREQAEQATRAKSKFLASMSHEMRTPLNAITGMTTIARNTSDSERMAYCLDKIDSASRHLLGVVNDILDMAKIEANKLELSPTIFDFAEMIDRAVGITSFRIEERKQTLSVDIDGEIPSTILADEQHLVQVLINLLSNAVKFTPEYGCICLSAKKIADCGDMCTIRFSVKDTGIGISEEQQRHLFVAFNQADSSFSRKFGGTGLGLAISKRIISMMGGDIWIESLLGEGASFIFDIKVKSEQSIAQDAAADDPQRGFASYSDIFRGKRVLIAEDVDINREIIAALLEETRIELVFAMDGKDAVEKFSATPQNYDAILMDIHMPGMDGYEATRCIRSSGLEGASSIPIIAMTANVFREDIDRCLASGMNGHLAKPIDAAALVAELKKAVIPGLS